MKPSIAALEVPRVIAIAILLFLPTKITQAATVEGFESTTLNSSNSIGDAGIRTPDYFGISPTEGTHELLLTTISTAGGHDPGPNQSGTNADTVGNIAAFLGVDSPNIRNTLPFPPQTGQEGSAFKLELGFLTAGTVVTFDYNFLTTEPSDTLHRDFAFITLTGLLGNTPVVVDALNATFSTTGIGNPFNLETHYLTYTINIVTDGTYTLGIGVMDATTTDNPSALLVDNISVAVAPIPEPSTVSLGVAGAVLLIASRRRFKKTLL